MTCRVPVPITSRPPVPLMSTFVPSKPVVLSCRVTDPRSTSPPLPFRFWICVPVTEPPFTVTLVVTPEMSSTPPVPSATASEAAIEPEPLSTSLPLRPVSPV